MRRVVRFQQELPNGRWSTFLRNHDQTRTLTALGGTPGRSSADAVARAKLAVTLLLTLPGLPFIYYGEEIGMTGDKPDELLRTPMQWSSAANAGFTRGTPWEPLSPGWSAATVAAQENSSTSLLALHRRLIHLRANNVALGVGDFVPLTASEDAIAAYLRRDGERVALVVANLGTRPLSGVSLSSMNGVLAPGTYEARSLLGAQPAARMSVTADGRLHDHVPLGTIGPVESHIFALTRAQ